MQALKALVIFLGVLIVIMMGIVAYGIVVKFGDVMEGEETAQAPVLSRAWESNPRVSLPAGARVVGTVVADGRMVVRLELPDGSQRYLVFDLDGGEQLGTIDLDAEGQ